MRWEEVETMRTAGLTYREIADQLRISVPAAKQYARRAREIRRMQAEGTYRG